MIVHLKKVRWKNLLSYGETFTEIVLDRSPSTVITGTNGTGKSSVLEAICVALFGKPFRKINKDQLINTKNGKGLLTEIELDVGQDSYLIRRGFKPSIFEVFKNGVLQNQPGANRDYQKTLEGILKFDYSSFTQIVLVGKATNVSFMKLDSNKRRAFVETILNLGVFSTMNKMHTQKLSQIKENLLDLKSDLAVAGEKVKLRQSHIITLEREEAESTTQEVEKIKKHQAELVADIAELLERKDNYFKQIVDLDPSTLAPLKKKVKDLSGMQGKMNFKSDDVNKQVKQIEAQDTCPTCGQDITDEFKHSKMHALNEQLSQLSVAQAEISEKLVNLETQLDDLENKNTHNDKLQQELAAISALVADKKNQISRLEGTLADSKTNSTDKIEAERAELTRLEEEHADLLKARAAAASELEYFNLMSNMLKDNGIKATIIRRFIPIINHYINSNLARLGFFAKFTLDESFEETIQARGIDTLSYNNFSEGEKLRIDMAILLAWREVAKLQNSVSTNLLFFDEIMDASMDNEGTEALAILLNEMKTTNIFIISHTPEKIADKVRSQIVFYKENGFSRMRV